MSDRHRATLRDRIATLSRAGREALSRELGSGGADRLMAYIVLDRSADGAAAPDLPNEDQLRAFLAERLPAYMVPAQFALLDRLPRTAAGKLDRRALALELGIQLAPASRAVVAPRTPIEATLAGIWKDVLRVDEISVHDDFFEIGGDSLLSIRVIARAGREGLRIPVERFFENPTIAHLATVLDHDAAREATTGPTTEPGEDATGEAPLTPIQHWFLDAITEHRDHWNQSYLVELTVEVEREALEAVIRALVDHHDALRLRLIQRDGEWRQDFQPPSARVPLRIVDLSADDSATYADRVAAEGDAEHASLRLEDGTLFRCVYFEGANGWRRLLVVAHHIVVDAVSWDVLLEDLSTLLGRPGRGAPQHLSTGTASAREWAIRLAQEAAAPVVAASAPHWLSLAAREPSRVPVDVHGDAGGNLAGDAAVVTIALDAEESARLLSDAALRLEAPPQALLLGALLLAWRRWTGEHELLLDVEGHGRDVLGDALDVSRTVGWFTTVFPVRLALPNGASGADETSAASVVRAVQSTLSALPMRGASHGLLRWLSPDAELRRALAAQRRPQVLFNYLGVRRDGLSANSPIRVAPEPAGRTRSPASPRAYILEINSYVDGGRVTVHIEYSRRLHLASSIERLASEMRTALGAISAARPDRFALAALDDSGMSLVADLLAEVDDA
jgi:non-ribosomal peptide synthase protein (TIGR01720 family)